MNERSLPISRTDAADVVVVAPHAGTWTCAPAPVGVPAYHRSIPGYAPTHLRELPALARELGVDRVFVKDESARFGLPAFKALGVSYAVQQLIRERSGATDLATWDDLVAAVQGMAPFTLVTATDGNHGRAVARFARQLGLSAHVVVPDVVSAAAIEAIRGEQAQVTVVSDDYDSAVQQASAITAADPNAELLQDTAWPGYEVIPQWIVDGYSTLLAEVDDQLAAAGVEAPDAVIVPAGVGSFAQAVVTHYRSAEARPTLICVEPDTAACIQASLRATIEGGDHVGNAVTVPTGATIMAGLNCGTPSSLAWPLLREGLDIAVAVSDQSALAAIDALIAQGLRPGPCGASTLAALQAVVGHPERLLTEDATVVLLSTEGQPASAS